MAVLESHAKWTFSESSGVIGGGKAHNSRAFPALYSFYGQTGEGCTATIQIQTCAGSSAGPSTSLGTASALSTSGAVLIQFSGPLEWVRPYCSMKTTGTLSVEMFGN